jgi:hypothetical protein
MNSHNSQDVPRVPLAPAPWELEGCGYIVLLRLDPNAEDAVLAVPPPLRGKRAGRLAILMLVDYSRSPVGPYRELLFIPGRYPFEDGKRHYTISRIVVSTWASVVNGRRNWGIPKEQAEFRVQTDPLVPAVEDITVGPADHAMAHLRFKRMAPPLPAPGALIPASLRTLAQHHEGKLFIYCPEASAVIRPARLLQADFDPEQFPDLNGCPTLATIKVDRFRMRFPAARVREVSA